MLYYSRGGLHKVWEAQTKFIGRSPMGLGRGCQHTLFVVVVVVVVVKVKVKVVVKVVEEEEEVIVC